MNVCTLTDSAKSQIDALCEENNCYAISLNLKGGGCAGFSYDWGTVETAEDVEDGDEVVATDGTGHFIIGKHSLMFLIGTEVDYTRSIVGSQFEIRNPNAVSACGCGVSINFNI